MKAARCRCIVACRSAAFTKPNKLHYAVVNLGLIEKFIAAGKLDAKAEITEDAIIAAGLTKNKLDGIRVLAKGEIKTKVNLTVSGRFRLGCRSGRKGRRQGHASGTGRGCGRIRPAERDCERLEGRLHLQKFSRAADRRTVWRRF
jgi:hypothetical protein